MRSKPPSRTPGGSSTVRTPRDSTPPPGTTPSGESRVPGATRAPAHNQPRDRKAVGPRPSRPPEPGQAPRPRPQPQARNEPRAPMIDTSKPRPASFRPAPRPVEPGRADPGRAESGRETLRAPAQPAGAAPAPARTAGIAAPRGSVWLHGIHAVAAALANPSRRLKRLVATEDGEANLLTQAPLPWPLPAERIDRARLDAMLGRDTVHQGVAVLADLLTPPALATVLARPGPLLLLDQVTDPRNIGATLRSAAAFGAAGVILQERNAPEETGVMAKAASGALETVPLIRAVNLSRTLIALKAAGLWVIGLDAGAPPLRGTALKDRRVVLVLGAEGDGMRRLTRETCDELVGLAMPGVMESLNVSAAATLALYELTRPE